MMGGVVYYVTLEGAPYLIPARFVVLQQNGTWGVYLRTAQTFETREAAETRAMELVAESPQYIGGIKAVEVKRKPEPEQEVIS